MADITANFTLTCQNGSYYEQVPAKQAAIDQAAIGRYGGVQKIGTSEEVVAFGDVATAGWLYLENLDATNFVEFGPESAGAMVAMGKLLAGEWCWLRMKPAVVLRAKADTAEIKLDVRLFEN